MNNHSVEIADNLTKVRLQLLFLADHFSDEKGEVYQGVSLILDNIHNMLEAQIHILECRVSPSPQPLPFPTDPKSTAWRLDG